MIELPTVLEVRGTGDERAIQLWIGADLACLAGHFPGHPVVSGAMQVGWALALAAAHLGTPDACREMEALKFQHLLQPEQPVTLTLHHDRARNKLHFAWRAGDTAYSSGRLLLEPSA